MKMNKKSKIITLILSAVLIVVLISIAVTADIVINKYTDYLPGNILPNFEKQSLNRGENQEINVDYSNSDDNSTLAVSIKKFEFTSNVSNPDNPDTYNYSQYLTKNGLNDTANVVFPENMGIFYSMDVSEEILSDMFYTASNGEVRTSIRIICDKYLVAYNYSGKEVDAADFYNMITSSPYYLSLPKKAEIHSYAGPTDSNTPDYFPPYSEPSVEELQNRMPYAFLMPQNIIDDLPFAKSYKTEHDDIVTGSSIHARIDFTKTGDASENGLMITISDIENSTVNSAIDYSALSIEKIQNNIVKKEGLITLKITVKYDCYLITYQYNGPDISAKEIYNMITSSEIFKHLQK